MLLIMVVKVSGYCHKEHNMPKRGIWLDITEIETRIMDCQALEKPLKYL